VVEAYMAHVQDNAEEAVRRVLATLADGAFAYELDDGSVVKVAITVDRAARTARVDFTGTSDQVPTNFNAPASICRAAALYVFRTLVDDEIPMNDGCLRPVELVIPEGSMLRPRYPAAVVAGNVETSQVVVDALYGALGVMAGGPGDDEQLHLRRRRGGSTTRPSAAGRGGAGLRRRRRGPDPHDQQPPDRSGGAGEPLSGAGRGVLDPARLGRRGRASRRRRRGAQDRLPRADDGDLAVQPAARGAVRAGGRRPGCWAARVERADGSVQALGATDASRSRRAMRS
jgi:5-oxoprolinase (ATP-hydrolysing)